MSKFHKIDANVLPHSLIIRNGEHLVRYRCTVEDPHILLFYCPWDESACSVSLPVAEFWPEVLPRSDACSFTTLCHFLRSGSGISTAKKVFPLVRFSWITNFWSADRNLSLEIHLVGSPDMCDKLCYKCGITKCNEVKNKYEVTYE